MTTIRIRFDEDRAVEWFHDEFGVLRVREGTEEELNEEEPKP